MKRVLLAVVMLSGLAGCASAPAEPPSPNATTPPPPVTFSATIHREGNGLRISYTLVNNGTAPVVALNGVPAQEQTLNVQPDLNAVYVTGRGDHSAEIAKRAFAMPNGKVAYEAPFRITGVTVQPGQSVAEDIAVPLPLTRRHPYGNDLGDGLISLPDPVREVVFCLGVLTGAGDPPYPHLSSTTGKQHLFCSHALTL